MFFNILTTYIYMFFLGFLGPWGKYKDEETTSKPSEEDAAYLEDYLSKMKKRAKKTVDETPMEEKSTLHIKICVFFHQSTPNVRSRLLFLTSPTGAFFAGFRRRLQTLCFPMWWHLPPHGVGAPNTGRCTPRQ